MNNPSPRSYCGRCEEDHDDGREKQLAWQERRGRDHVQRCLCLPWPRTSHHSAGLWIAALQTLPPLCPPTFSLTPQSLVNSPKFPLSCPLSGPSIWSLFKGRGGILVTMTNPPGKIFQDLPDSSPWWRQSGVKLQPSVASLTYARIY